MHLSRWDGAATLHFVRLPTAADAVEADALGGAAIELDAAGRIIGVRWSDGSRAPAPVRPLVARTSPTEVELWLTDLVGEASATSAVVSDVRLRGEVRAHVDEEGLLVGVAFLAAPDQLPGSVLEAIEKMETAADERARAGEDDDALASVVPGSVVDLGWTLDHRAVTDEVATETFSFHSGPLSSSTFIAELRDAARHYGVRLECFTRRGALWGLLGVDVECSATGSYSAITDFAVFARARLRAWRDGDVAG